MRLGFLVILFAVLLSGCASSERMSRMSGGVFQEYSAPKSYRIRSEKFQAKTRQLETGRNPPIGGIEGLEGTGEVTLLDIEHLQSRTFTDIIYILLVCEAIESHTAVISDTVLFHNFMNALEHEHGLVVVGLHTFVNYLSQLGIVAHKEPRVNADAVTSHTGARL